MQILHVVGARPNFMKVAPIMRAIDRLGLEQSLVHTGQHYDDALSDQFFSDLEIPRPNLNLGVGSGSHGVQTGRMLIALEPVLKRLNPDWLFTVGDVNSTLAAALVAAKLRIPLAHVEAGLRSGDRDMPEEINRVVTDALGDILFTTERAANENLHAEGVDPGRVRFVGNVMIDTLDRFRPRAAERAVHEAMGLEAGEYLLATLHRPENVDDPARLKQLLDALVATSSACRLPLVLPLHPRTARNIRGFGLDQILRALIVLTPLGYLDFLCLLDHAAAVLTDSGGVQEETTVLGVPCLTLRTSTDRPVTLTHGTSQLFHSHLDGLPEAVRGRLDEGRRPCRPPLWDGRAAERIAAAIAHELPSRNAELVQERMMSSSMGGI
jgi:UDP-N-acetylglucosamine 2-epimerase (non-hydrolysing)